MSDREDGDVDDDVDGDESGDPFDYDDADADAGSEEPVDAGAGGASDDETADGPAGDGASDDPADGASDGEAGGGPADDGDDAGPADLGEALADADEEELPDAIDVEDVPQEAEEAFDEMEVGSVEESEVWSKLEDDTVEHEPEGGREVVVPKKTYCERCEFFSAPPEMHCEHGGTSILELVDREHVRVVNCPVVDEREALGEQEAAPSEQEAAEQARDDAMDVFIQD